MYTHTQPKTTKNHKKHPPTQDPEKIKEGTAALSRNHVIEVSPSKLVTVTGGKWTTYRRMAEDTVDRVLKARKEFVDG